MAAFYLGPTPRHSYDDNGNLFAVSAPNTAWLNQRFDYDAQNRLVSAVGSYGAISYTYDRVGNRTSRTINGQTDTYRYQPGTNRLEEISGPNPAAFSYDANGNITAIDSKTLIYNQNNRLIRVEQGVDILGEYRYNGTAQRIIKEAAGATTVYHYDFDGNLIAESSADGSFYYEYLYMGGSRLARVEVGTGELTYYLNNYLGTPILMTDDAGTVVWEAAYPPFGEARVNANSTVVNNFRFSGQYYDEETGLHYNYHRYYDPKTGRYLTPDPVGLLGGINLYVYVANNPVNFFDPRGLWIGQGPPPPPGYNPDTWNPRWDQKFKNWTVTDPETGNDWTVHEEDPGHWRHWDNQNTGERFPKRSKKTQKKQKKLNEDQSPCDPSGDEPEWLPPIDEFSTVDLFGNIRPIDGRIIIYPFPGVGLPPVFQPSPGLVPSFAIP